MAGMCQFRTLAAPFAPTLGTDAIWVDYPERLPRMMLQWFFSLDIVASSIAGVRRVPPVAQR